MERARRALQFTTEAAYAASSNASAAFSDARSPTTSASSAAVLAVLVRSMISVYLRVDLQIKYMHCRGSATNRIWGAMAPNF